MIIFIYLRVRCNCHHGGIANGSAVDRNRGGIAIANFMTENFMRQNNDILFMTDNFMQFKLCVISEYYLHPQKFVLYYDHRTHQYINSQRKLSNRHGKWEMSLLARIYLRNHTKIKCWRLGSLCTQQSFFYGCTSGGVWVS